MYDGPNIIQVPICQSGNLNLPCEQGTKGFSRSGNRKGIKTRDNDQGGKILQKNNGVRALVLQTQETVHAHAPAKENLSLIPATLAQTPLSGYQAS